jgi:hypothetical protein
MKQKLNPAAAAVVILVAIGIAVFVMFKFADKPDDRQFKGMPNFGGGGGKGAPGTGGPGKGAPGKAGAPNQKPADAGKKAAPTPTDGKE